MKDNKGNIASGIQAEDHAKMVLDLDGTRVGNSAQTTFALGAKYQPLKGLRVGADYTYWMRNYANFSVGGSDVYKRQNNRTAGEYFGKSGTQKFERN